MLSGLWYVECILCHVKWFMVCKMHFWCYLFNLKARLCRYFTLEETQGMMLEWNVDSSLK